MPLAAVHGGIALALAGADGSGRCLEADGLLREAIAMQREGRAVLSQVLAQRLAAAATACGLTPEL